MTVGTLILPQPTFRRQTLLADDELERRGAEEPGPGAAVGKHTQVIQDVLFKVSHGRTGDLHRVDVLCDIDRLSLLPIVHLEQWHVSWFQFAHGLSL